MNKKANMIFVSGVPDQVAAGDQASMQVCLVEEQDFVAGVEVTVSVEDFSVACIMEKPDMSSISIPDEAMDDPELRKSYEELFVHVPTSVSTQETDESGQAVFLINFQTPGVTKFFVSWHDRGELRTEEKKVVVFHKGLDQIMDHELQTGADEISQEKDRVTDHQMGVPSLAGDVEGDRQHAIETGMEEFSYQAAHEGEEQEFDPEIITLDSEIQEIPEGMDDEEYVESQKDLHADVDAPDELFFGGEGVIRVKIRNTWGGVADHEVELESLTQNINVFSNTRLSDDLSIISDQTGEDGFVEFRINHVGTEAEDVRMIIRWDKWGGEGEGPKSTEVVIKVYARSLHPVVEAPSKSEVGSRVQIKLHVHELGKPVQGIPTTISSDSEDVAFFLITRDSRADVESDCADTDHEGNVIFQMRHQGKEDGAVQYSIQWNRDGEIETIHSSTIEFFKPEDVIQEEVMSQEDTKSKTEKKPTDPKKKGEKRSYRWVYIVLGILVIIFIGGAWISLEQGLFKPVKTGKPAPPATASLDQPEIFASKSEEAKDTELSAPTETEGEEDLAVPAPESEGGEELVLTMTDIEEGEAEPSGEELPPPAEEPAAAVAPDAITYDVRTETVLVYNDSLGKSLKQGRVNKIKLKKAQKEVEDLEKKLKQSNGASMTLAASNDSLEGQIEAMKQEIASLQSGEPNLELIKVDKIECTGKYKEIKGKKGEIIGVKIPKCRVYLSTIEPK